MATYLPILFMAAERLNGLHRHLRKRTTPLLFSTCAGGGGVKASREAQRVEPERAIEAKRSSARFQAMSTEETTADKEKVSRAGFLPARVTLRA